MHPSYIVSLSSVLLKLIQFRLLYIVYAAGLGSETTSRKKRCYTTYCINCYNWFWCVEKYLCFKRHVGPIVQKGHIVNIPLSEEETDMVLQNRLYTCHPSIPWDQQYTLHEKVHSSISNTEKTKYSHLDRETLMIMRRPWYWDSEAEDKEYQHS